MIEVIEHTIDRAKLDHDLIVPITTPERNQAVRYLEFVMHHNSSTDAAVLIV